MTDSESLTELLQQFRSYPDNELLEMAGSPTWALLTHQAIRGVLEERGIAAPPIPEEAKAIPAPAIARSTEEQRSSTREPIQSDPTHADARPGSPSSSSAQARPRRRRKQSSWLGWLGLLIAFYSTIRLSCTISSCVAEHGSHTRTFVRDSDDSDHAARRPQGTRALHEEFERLNGHAQAGSQENVTSTPRQKSSTQDGAEDPEPSEESVPNQEPVGFQWRHAPRLSSAATITIMRASRLCQPEMVTETRNPFTKGKVFVCPAADYPTSGPILPPNLLFQGSVVGSFSGTGKLEAIVSVFGDDLRYKSLGSSALLRSEQDAWKSLFQDHRLSLSDCTKITAEGVPDRLLCVADEGPGVGGLADPGSPSLLVTKVVLLSASDSKFMALPLAQLDKGAIRCGKEGSAGTEVAQLAQDGNTISVTLERDEAKCPSVPSSITLRWTLSASGATPDKASKRWLKQLAIAPGPGPEAQGQ